MLASNPIAEGGAGGKMVSGTFPMASLSPVQILRTQSFYNHGVGDLEGLSKRFYHKIIEGFRLTFPAESNPFGGAGGGLELGLQMAGWHQYQAGKGVRLIFKPAVIGFVHFDLELLPLADACEPEFGVEAPVQIPVSEFVRQREAITVHTLLKNELIDPDGRQVAGNKPVHCY